MAALLPHTTLEIANGNADTVLADGNSTQGIENRKAILERALPGRATALKADDLLAMSRDDSRALMRDCDVLYVYHNRIDAVGDKRDTEERVFEAAADALDDLVRIVKKLANANANNMIVTADHGFLYQHRELEESDFASQEATGANITNRNRRFVLGTGLDATSSFKHFRAQDVGSGGRHRTAVAQIHQPPARQGVRQPLCARRRGAARGDRAGRLDQQEAAKRPERRCGRYPAWIIDDHQRRPVERRLLPN